MMYQTDHLTIHIVIRGWAEQTPNAHAIAAPGRVPLTYSQLWNQIKWGAEILNKLGIGRGDRIVIAVPQGPEMAVATLTVCTVSIGVPLNILMRTVDLDATLGQLKPKALVIQSGTGGSILAVARKHKIPIIQLNPIPTAPAGVFKISGEGVGPIAEKAFNEPDDISLILPTSGTTSQPKFVLLTQRNFCAAADNTRSALGLTQIDKCLNVMPLFHGHGLVAGVIASLMAGASVMCTPVFDANKFFTWMDEFRPTWYTAVPTMHQAILSEADKFKEVIVRNPLRFIRSASASLPLTVMEELECVFKCLVTESYGLSEALQITNTPLDLQKRKVGSLGLPGTSEVGIMGEDGRLMGPGEIGEIVCRGPIIMAGYFNDKTATEQSFRNGWFRTGDIGYIDADGHLYMTGRMKEIINRGGEKVSPQEIDQILTTHPAIAQAVTFGIPDPIMGEEIAAVVTLRPGMSATPGDIREFAATRLSDFKVPRRVLIVPKIPTSPTGKLVRREMIAHFGSLLTSITHSGVAIAKPRTPTEQQLVNIWEELLNVRPLGITDDFFDYGGNSLIAARMMEEIEKAFGKTLHPSVLFSEPTVEKLAGILKEQLDPDPLQRPLIEVQRGGDRVPFIFLNGDYYSGGFYCRNLARELGPQQPFYTFSPYSIESSGAPNTIEAMAEAYLKTLLAMQLNGPYLIGGFSHAGLIAYEMARQLKGRGEDVALLVVIDTPMADPRLRFLRKFISAIGLLTGIEPKDQSEVFLKWRRRIAQLRTLFEGGFSLQNLFGIKKNTKGHKIWIHL